MTAIGQEHLQPVQAALPFLDAWSLAETVLQKQKASARLEHTVDLGKCLNGVLDAAQRKRADDTIESAVLEGKPFAAYDSLVNLDLRGFHPLLRQSVHPDVRIDRRDLADLGRVVRQVQ